MCKTAGADLSELAKISTAEAYSRKYLKDLGDAISSFRKPILAAVTGFAVSQTRPARFSNTNLTQFGGGFELALMVGEPLQWCLVPVTMGSLLPQIFSSRAGANRCICSAI
tara:strand:- start:20188 stop:20520 length:333 start_codon:yes stop_codon:yes gene_type:complete